MKTKIFIIALNLAMNVSVVQAQYSVSINYGNVDWIPKSNRVLRYENAFILQSYVLKSISIWQASLFTNEASNCYELGGLDYSKSFSNVKIRLGLHGFFPKMGFISYTTNGNLIPNIGLTKYGITVNCYQFWNYSISDQYLASNLVYKKTFAFGSMECGQYYNGKAKAFSGSLAYSKNWPIYKSMSGFASIRWSFNESKTKLNEGNFIIINIGLKI